MTTYQLFRPEKQVDGAIVLDGSKSISNRLLVLKHISNEPFEIENLSISDDTQLMSSFFDQYPNISEFNVHNAGTVARFLTAYLSIQPGTFILNCAEPMKKRPIKILVDALRDLGAKIDYLENDGFLPLKIEGVIELQDSVHISADVSSQYISALMMIAPKIPNGLSIYLDGTIASKPYLEITQHLMQEVGFRVEFDGQLIQVKTGQNVDIPNRVFNESDWSAAAFYYTICSLANIQELDLSMLFQPENSSQGDSKVSQYFESIGVQSQFNNLHVLLKPETDHKSELTFDFLDVPDMVPALAVAVATKGIETTFTGVRNLVIKESNRLEAMKNELAKLDVDFYEIDYDTWKLVGKINTKKFPEVVIDTYEDHRIAMAFGCLGFLADGLTIREPEVVSKSYPQFWSDLQKLGLKVNSHH